MLPKLAVTNSGSVLQHASQIGPVNPSEIKVSIRVSIYCRTIVERVSGRDSLRYFPTKRVAAAGIPFSNSAFYQFLIREINSFCNQCRRLYESLGTSSASGRCLAAETDEITDSTWIRGSFNGASLIFSSPSHGRTFSFLESLVERTILVVMSK